MRENPTTFCSSQNVESMTGKSRRGFFEQAAAVLLGGAALLVPGVTALVAFLNPLRQKSQSGQWRQIVSLDLLHDGEPPRGFAINADREDAWNFFPNEPIGSVFLRRAGNEVQALQVICPHAGCSISLQSTPEGNKFVCPCHLANFDLDGKRTDAVSPSPRDMDALEVEIRNTNEIWVKFQTFQLGMAAKVAQG
jgi:menaquinol-cytochrome c reductase iron-sulfur subunit